MAKLQIEQHGAATIIMANGKVIPVPPNYDSMTISVPGAAGSGVYPDLITFSDGGEFWITDYERVLIDDGMADDLADGEAFTSHDGCTWTRYGNEMLVVTPAATKQRLAA